ncbi:MAG TPA: FecR family protein [Elusimicrobiales bacterium]|nr:FecR family protein [Elusimicrobiales bacterium]
MTAMLLAAALLLAPLPASAGQAGCVYDLSGPAQILRAGQEAWLAAGKGSPLGAGDKLRTGERGWCEVLLKDGTFVKLEAGSETLVEDLGVAPDSRSFSFQLLRGKTLWLAAKLKAAVRSKFLVRTPSAVCAVRGTDFSLIVSSAGATSLGLFEGKVAVSAPGGPEQELLSGNEASAGEGGIALKTGLSREMKAEERRCAKLKNRVESLRKRLAERDDFIEDYINRQQKKLSDFETRRAEKLRKR